MHTRPYGAANECHTAVALADRPVQVVFASPVPKLTMLLHYSQDLPLQLLPVHICHILCAKQEALQGGPRCGALAVGCGGGATPPRADWLELKATLGCQWSKRSGPISSRGAGAERDHACSPSYLLGQFDLVILLL